MKVRDLEDMLVSLFDPLLTMTEKTSLLRDYQVDFSWCLSNAGGSVPIDGIEVVFKDGSAYRLIIIPTSER